MTPPSFLVWRIQGFWGFPPFRHGMGEHGGVIHHHPSVHQCTVRASRGGSVDVDVDGFILLCKYPELFPPFVCSPLPVQSPCHKNATPQSNSTQGYAYSSLGSEQPLGKGPANLCNLAVQSAGCASSTPHLFFVESTSFLDDPICEFQRNFQHLFTTLIFHPFCTPPPKMRSACVEFYFTYFDHRMTPRSRILGQNMHAHHVNRSLLQPFCNFDPFPIFFCPATKVPPCVITRQFLEETLAKCGFFVCIFGLAGPPYVIIFRRPQRITKSTFTPTFTVIYFTRHREFLPE